jgi:hypothetical protein
VFDAANVKVLLVNEADVSEEGLLVLTDADGDVVFAGEELTSDVIELGSSTVV